MIFCRHCGKSILPGRFCSVCGGALVSDATENAANKRRILLFLFGATVVLIVLLMSALVVGRNITEIHKLSALPRAILPASTSPQSVSSSITEPSVPQSRPPQNENNLENRASSIDPKNIQKALTELAENKKQRNSQPEPAEPSSITTGSDYYPGSQRLELKDVDLPNIGISYSNEVYGTTDSVSAVVAYYSKRYPDAQIMDVNGQKVIASEHAGSAKVIAVGAAGSETRIAIIKTE